MKVKVDGIRTPVGWRYVAWCPRCQRFPAGMLYRFPYAVYIADKHGRQCAGGYR